MAGILAEAVIAVGICPQGIPFGGRGLTDVFFLICSTSDHEHLRVLARLSRVINDALVLDELRSADSPQQVLDTLLDRDEELNAAGER